MNAQRLLTSVAALALLLMAVGVVSAQGPVPQSAADIPLPVNQSISLPATAFSITNTGTGQDAVGVAGSTNQGYAGVVGHSLTRYGVFGLSASNANAGVFGRNDSTGVGVLGRSNQGIGIVAESGSNAALLAHSVSSVGVLARSDTTHALRAEGTGDGGIWATTPAVDRAAIWGEHLGSGLGYGVVGVTQFGHAVRGQSFNGQGVFGVGTVVGVEGVATAAGGAGFYAHVEGQGATAIRAVAANGKGIDVSSNGQNAILATAVNADVIEVASTSKDKAALYAHYDNTNEAGFAVYATARRGPAVYARSSGGDGIATESSKSGQSGLYSSFDGSEDKGNAAYFDGRVEVNGTLAKSAGSFKIDHPLDPANKFLQHSFVESPDMMNVYNGNVVTDAKGEAVITLPDYFQALNRDFRYQLTPIGQFAQAIVAKEVDNNRFVIQTDKPGVKVSWQVTGIRQDAYARAHPIEVEPAKPDAEKGYYLSPAELGQPASTDVNWVRRPEMMQRREAEKAGLSVR